MAVSVVEVRLDARTATQNAAKFKREMDGAANSIKKTDRAAATATANIQRFGIAFRSVVGPLVAVTGAVTLLSRSLTVLGDRQADAAALENGLKKLGRVDALQNLQKVADELGKATLFNQEDFDRGFALLTSFQSIGVGAYERVATAAADVAQITGQDVNSSLLQLAKALQDPERGLTALARSGTTFTESQKEQIKQLVKSGDLLQAQDLILREIEKQYGNAAKVAGSSGFAGSVDSLGESFRDFQEKLATGVLPIVTTLNTALAGVLDVFSAIPTPVGQAALAIGGVATAMVALDAATKAFMASKLASFIATQTALFQTFGAQIYLTAAAQGAMTTATTLLTAALNLLPLAAVATGLTLIAVEIWKAYTAQKAFEELLNSGSYSKVQAEIKSLTEQIKELETRSLRAAAGMSLLGGEGELSAVKLAQLRTKVAQLKEVLAGLDPSNDPAVPKIPTLPTIPTPDGGSAEAKKQADELARSVAAGAQLLTQYSRQIELLTASNEIERERLEIQFAYEDRAAQITKLKDEDQKKLLELKNAEIQRLELLELQTKELDKQLEKAGDIADKVLEGSGVSYAGKGTIAGGLKEEIGKLEEELKPIKVATESIIEGAYAISDAFSTAFGDVITGSKSTQEALSDAFASIGDAFISMALEIIAKQMTLILLQTLYNALASPFEKSLDSVGNALSGSGALLPEKMFPTGIFAEGGYVTSPTNATVGEGGSDEYIVPSSKMDGAMSRWNQGMRGDAVVSGAEPTGGYGGAAVAEAPTNITIEGGVLNFNDSQYIRQDQVPSIVKQASAAGEAQALRKLQMSTATRKRLGL